MLNYKSKDAAIYFSQNRNDLDDFYKSEKFVLNSLIKSISNFNGKHGILDIGCAAGGLGKALNDKLNGKLKYIGIDINPLSIEFGQKINKDLHLIQGDFREEILKLSNERINTVISLSCIDWNNDFNKSIKIIRNYCKQNKSDFIFTFRTAQKGINNIKESYQYVNYKNLKEGEIATYVVLSHNELKDIIKSFKPKEIKISAYKGTPSKVAVTPHKELIFGCIWLKDCFKRESIKNTVIEGHFPLELLI